jgi:hypothetical protein
VKVILIEKRECVCMNEKKSKTEKEVDAGVEVGVKGEGE